MKAPLFPLRSLVCPRGRLSIQVFEPRYLDMLSQCLREERGFVVVMIKEGGEVGPCLFHDIGTYVQMVDFEQLPNGLLGITAEGQGKVAILESARQKDGLYTGEIEWLVPEDHCVMPAQYLDLATLLKELLRHPMISSLDMEVDFDSASDVGWRLTELLPLENRDKQQLLVINEPVRRLEQIRRLLRELEDN